jgi:hypothetical protein
MRGPHGTARRFPVSVGAQPAEAQQADVLTIFRDGSEQNLSGMAHTMGLRALGMAESLASGRPALSSARAGRSAPGSALAA